MHDEWMRMALQEAALAAAEGEVPVGAVAILQGTPLARDHNRSIQLSDPTAHAEVLALREAARILDNYRLGEVEIYTTLEPCAMCAGALIWARVKRLVFGAADEKGGAVVSKAALLEPGLFNHSVEVVSGVLAEESRVLLREFFEARR